ncbi:MAG TPA: hypothetical protein PKN21_01265 [Bacteroidales bacterium]|nr:hypothetical protein [Bacteroidales bacterium]
MNNFTDFDFHEILGGASTYKFIPVTDVVSIPLPVNGIITDAITLVSGKQWFTGYASLGSLQLDESWEDTAAGRVNNVTIKGFYPDIDNSMLSILEEMLSYRYLVQVTDAMGKVRLGGSLTEPLIFNFARSTKAIPAERPGYEFQFSGKLKTSCYIYQEPTAS